MQLVILSVRKKGLLNKLLYFFFVPENNCISGKQYKWVQWVLLMWFLKFWITKFGFFLISPELSSFASNDYSEK